MEDKPLLVIVGPTAAGKTELGIQLANRLSGEIISGDSIQVYQGLNIGTAKASPAEREDTPHHLIDILPPDASYSVADFKDQALACIDGIHQQSKLPMIVGGTGLYIQSIVYPYEFTEKSGSAEVRLRLEKEGEMIGKEALHKRLADVDPKAAKSIHPNNVRRVIRALEVYETTSERPSDRISRQADAYRYNTFILGLTMDRQELYERINQRVDHMVEEGLFQEVEALFKSGYENCQSMQAIGYKEIVSYFRGDCTQEESIAQLKKNTRRFAKRQLTWFRNKMDVEWIDVTTSRSMSKIADEILPSIAGKLRF
ncbi:tRNA (adenosine(37)-N6)-dimethylallyltransferase MiaA [Aureibacillus halotolerans]|uniref:tRNA dimethylallyltransferase n=1 Tax=Aureibacillus halotolerans TaxID=1508390 RepID=A0A4R6U5H0_9BACI|nr:tRNA (adenosine(37)-N6)-dimethylallyltransferase MiaA [Aureibacillus halotolerans]TDQ39725.1 tRNA dimethylallyltransferase [Aureibacillus halotolerans]